MKMFSISIAELIITIIMLHVSIIFQTDLEKSQSPGGEAESDQATPTSVPVSGGMDDPVSEGSPAVSTETEGASNNASVTELAE